MARCLITSKAAFSDTITGLSFCLPDLTCVTVRVRVRVRVRGRDRVRVIVRVSVHASQTYRVAH